MSQIFLSYRRADSAAMCDRIYDALRAYYGNDAVFRDIDSIPLSVNFKVYIEKFIRNCAVELVIVGKNWRNIDDSGVSRLNDPTDFVRLEVETALRFNIPVIPLFVDNAVPPRADQIPASVAPLFTRNGFEVGYAPHFDDDMRRLIARLSSTFPVLEQRHLQSIQSAYTYNTFVPSQGTYAQKRRPINPSLLRLLQQAPWRLIGITTLAGVILESLVLLYLYHFLFNGAVSNSALPSYISLSVSVFLPSLFVALKRQEIRWGGVSGAVSGAVVTIIWLLIVSITPSPNPQDHVTIGIAISDFIYLTLFGIPIGYVGGLVGAFLGLIIRLFAKIGKSLARKP